MFVHIHHTDRSVGHGMQIRHGVHTYSYKAAAGPEKWFRGVSSQNPPWGKDPSRVRSLQKGPGVYLDWLTSFTPNPQTCPSAAHVRRLHVSGAPPLLPAL